MDFSKPIDPGQNIIDISTDNITTAIRLPDNIPRLEGSTLLISDGVMHMLPGRNVDLNITDADGKILDATKYRANLTNKVWNFDLESQKWEVHISGVEDQAQLAAIAFDAEKEVGWYYGGKSERDQHYNETISVDFASNESSGRALRDLYRLDRGKGTPQKVKTDSSPVGNVNQGELVYIEGVGEAGILVLMGGNVGVEPSQLVSIGYQNYES